MSYALNRMGLHGTHIYVTDLAKSNATQSELMATTDDICIRQERRANENLVDSVMTNRLLIENSLA